MYEKILVPLDGSELAEVALPYAEELAGKLGSEVTLLYVGRSTDDPHAHMRQFYLQRMVEVIKRSAQESLEKPAAKEIKVKSEVLVGNPAEQIVDYADKENIGLIVMATHGRTGIRRWTLGSVADKVVRATKRPVVLIRAKDAYPEVRETSILNKVLVCLDGSAESEAVIPYIEDLAAKLDCEVQDTSLRVLTVARVAQPPREHRERMPAHAGLHEKQVVAASEAVLVVRPLRLAH